MAPAEVACGPSRADAIEVLKPRDVPLGGPRGIHVRRTLPQRRRSLVGAWCFADHYGPHDVRSSRGMDVAPHPHTGLQTASWLFSGEVEHRDSARGTRLVRPGELNLMTAGAGICHSEVSTANTTLLHGVQLWIALPDNQRDTRARLRSLCARTHLGRRRHDEGVPGSPRRSELASAHFHSVARCTAGP